MSNHKFSQVYKIVITLLVITGSSFGLSLLVPKGGYKHLLLAIGKTSNTGHPETRVGSVSAQIVTNESNWLVKVPKMFAGVTVYKAKLKPDEKVIALTFDDGPGPKNTDQVLEILKENHIKATFFMIGEMVQFHPQVAKQVADDGHIIGNHTWHHWYKKLDAATAASEINRTTDIIYKTTGVKTTLFRPPGGFLHNGLADYAKNQKYTIMMWSDESGDTQKAKPGTLAKNVIKGAKPGAIVLMHDGGGNRSRSVKALPQIITALKSQGYRFVTIPDLLEIESREPSAHGKGAGEQEVKKGTQ